VWRLTEDRRPRFAALSLATLLASPHLLTYDLLLLVVPIALLTDWIVDATDRPPSGVWLAILAMLYFAAWPGTLLARVYGVQMSTVGMVMGLWLLNRPAERSGLSTGALSSIRPSISS
jgi:hypothetical protein